MIYCGPVFVVLALVLFSLCVYSFWQAVFGTAFWDRCSMEWRVIHGVLAVWVCFNIVFNYVMCVRTNPGTTKYISVQELQSAYPPPERWCYRCERPKPALAHHCSVCNSCTLCMDHHCPWVNNCVGFFNYRYFFNFLFWLTFSCVWAIPVFTRRYGYRVVKYLGPYRLPKPTTFDQVHAAHHFSAPLSLLLCLCVTLVVGGMLVWHIYLVCTAQGTIDIQHNRYQRKLAASSGKEWRNIFDLGVVKNWQTRFDSRGRFWWISWCLPRISPPRGNGYNMPTSKVALQWPGAHGV